MTLDLRRIRVSGLAHLLLASLWISFFFINSVQTKRQAFLPSSSPLKSARARDKTIDMPAINTLIARNGTIIGDISQLLDFAIIAFPKSGTTFMKDYLNSSSETWLYETEFCIKSTEDLQRFVHTYHNIHIKLKQSARNKQIKFGLKCPGVLYRNDIEIYRQYFPNTKLIVGLRHPVSWFESFYNYQFWRNVTMPPTSELMGSCTLHGKVCTDRARFHSALARLGLTEMDTEDEIALLFGSRDNKIRRRASQIFRMPNQLFLYEVRQIHDTQLSTQLSSDIQKYIQLEQNLPVIVSYTQTKSRAINICEEEHSNVRKLLVEHGKNAANWIREYLAKSPNVVVASADSFFAFLNDWGSDPCIRTQ